MVKQNPREVTRYDPRTGREVTNCNKIIVVQGRPGEVGEKHHRRAKTKKTKGEEQKE